MGRKTDLSKDLVTILREGVLVERALQRAARQTIEDHKKEGRPLVMWRGGQVVWMPAEELQAEIADRGAAPRKHRVMLDD